MRRFLAVYLFAMTVLVGFQAHTEDLSKLSHKLFNKIETELEKIEKADGANAAKAEILVAKKWIEDGRTFLSEGSLKKAAIIAERLPSQLELVRTLVAAGIVISKAVKAENANLEFSNRLRDLKARLDRYFLVYNGTKSTYANPSKNEGTK